MVDEHDDCDPYASEGTKAGEAAWRKVMGPELDEIDQAMATLRSARKVLADASLMRSIRERIAENQQAAKGGRDNGR